MSNMKSYEGFRNYLAVEQRENGFIPLRFTPKQLEEYAVHPVYQMRSYSPAGVCLDVYTDAAELTLEVEILNLFRAYLYFDLFVDDVFTGSEGTEDASAGIYTFKFNLTSKSNQRNRITIYFPHSVEMVIRRMTWSEGAVVEQAAAYSKNLLCLGDSITQGMNALHPSSTYTVLLSRRLGMNLLNQGVGGYYFNADSLDPQIPFQPDIITIAYGTNDWGRFKTRQELFEHVDGYLEAITRIFPMAQTFVLTPLWRVDIESSKPLGTYDELVETITEAVNKYPSISIIPGIDLIPHDPELLGDHAHPLDRGFQKMAEAIAEHLLK